MRGFMLNVKQYKLVIIFFTLIFMCSDIANAATISGSIYDLALQKESNVIVEINTLPRQLLVSKDGDYAFNINPGNYTLYAYTSIAKAYESVIIDDDNNYTLDIILEDTPIGLPDDSILKESDINVSSSDISDSSKSKDTLLMIGLFLVIALSIIIIYMLIYTKKIRSKSTRQDASHNISKSEIARHEGTHESKTVFKKSEAPLDEYAYKLLQIIKKEKRTTQKDLRKEVPLSEAKISLILSDLEDKGKIRKIKKGRGNILIFVKD